MIKILTCRDVGVDCDIVFRVETEDEIIKKAAEHAAKTYVLARKIVAVIATAICIIFGYYPARRASLLNPVDAIRYE